jgi:cupin 2 domain-containing protein
MDSGNLFAGLPDKLAEEAFSTLLEAAGLRLVRIVSTGQASPSGTWYDQAEAEWVVLLRGNAGLLIEGEAAPRRLGPGDWLLIPAHLRHRVEWTDPDQPNVWLALHHQAATVP